MNYRYGGDYLERLSIGDVLALYRMEVDIGKDLTEHDFISLTSRVGVKSKKQTQKVSPTSTLQQEGDRTP